MSGSFRMVPPQSKGISIFYGMLQKLFLHWIRMANTWSFHKPDLDSRFLMAFLHSGQKCNSLIKNRLTLVTCLKKNWPKLPRKFKFLFLALFTVTLLKELQVVQKIVLFWRLIGWVKFLLFQPLCLLFKIHWSIERFFKTLPILVNSDKKVLMFISWIFILSSLLESWWLFWPISWLSFENAFETLVYLWYEALLEVLCSHLYLIRRSYCCVCE